MVKKNPPPYFHITFCPEQSGYNIICNELCFYKFKSEIGINTQNASLFLEQNNSYASANEAWRQLIDPERTKMINPVH